MDNVLKVMDRYYEKFGEYFPTMSFQACSAEEICEMIEKCISKEKTAEELFELDYSMKY